MYASHLSLISMETSAQKQTPGETQRRRIVVQGIVRGVGFCPFVSTQARRYHLAGFVLNDSSGVTIEVEGTVQALGHFIAALCHEALPLARIDLIHAEPLAT